MAANATGSEHARLSASTPTSAKEISELPAAANCVRKLQVGGGCNLGRYWCTRAGTGLAVGLSGMRLRAHFSCGDQKASRFAPMHCCAEECYVKEWWQRADEAGYGYELDAGCSSQ